MNEAETVWIYLWPIEGENAGAGADARRAMIGRRLMRYARSYALACGMVFPESDPNIVRYKRGKPCLPDVSHLHFSLSHSGAYAACAFFGLPLGLDLQRHSTCRREAVARRFFHPREYDWLEQRSFEPFFQVWTAKESYVKFTGIGITSGFRHFCVVGADGELAAGLDGCRFFRWELPRNYDLCLCVSAGWGQTAPRVVLLPE